MAKHEKKPKRKELEVEIKILWFKLRFNKGSISFLPFGGVVIV